MNAVQGRTLWIALHAAAQMEATPESRERFHAVWRELVRENLPCASCFRKLEYFERKWPPDTADFYTWSLCLHDFVNQQLGRPLFHPQITREPLRARGLCT